MAYVSHPRPLALAAVSGVACAIAFLVSSCGRQPDPAAVQGSDSPTIAATQARTGGVLASAQPAFSARSSVEAEAASSDKPAPSPAATAAAGADVKAATNAVTKGGTGLVDANAPRNDPPRSSAPSSPPPYHRVHILAVGANDVPGWPRLYYADADAMDFAGVLRRRYGFTNLIVLTGTNATRARIEASFDEVRQKLAPDLADDFVFYFSGHGETIPEGKVADGQTNIIRHGFLITHDPTLPTNAPLAEMRRRTLEMSWLAERVIQLPARHRLIFLDSCFSGLAFAGQNAIRKPGEDPYAEVIQHRTVQIMTAGLETESVPEEPSLRHGLFTHALLKQIDDPSVRTMEEVFFPLRVEVRNQLAGLYKGTFSVTPQHRYLIHEEGTFVFVPADRLENWAIGKPSGPAYADAVSKGYLRPVEITEVNEVKNLSNPNLQQDPAWKEKLDRYETRASMGDTAAMAILSQVYGRGLGVQTDPHRAQLWSNEGHDAVKASSLFGVKDPKTAALVDAFIPMNTGRNGFGNVPGPSGNLGAKAGLAATLTQFFSGGGGGGGSLQGMESHASEALRLLDPSKPNYKAAQKRIQEWRRDLEIVVGKLPAGQEPAEVKEIRQQLDVADKKAGGQLRKSAYEAVEKALTSVQALKKQIPTETNPK